MKPRTGQGRAFLETMALAFAFTILMAFLRGEL